MGDVQRQELMSSLEKLFASSDYSDLTVFCGNDVHKVHKAIVCPRSDFFAAATRFGKEAVKGEVTLDHDDPATVRGMIHYLYHLDYDVPPQEVVSKVQETTPSSPLQEIITPLPPFEAAENSTAGPVTAVDEDLVVPSDAYSRGFSGLKSYKKKGKKDKSCIPSSPRDTILEGEKEPLSGQPAPDIGPSKVAQPTGLTFHAKIYHIADKYHIPGLKDLALAKYEVAATKDWDHVDFPESIHVVYTTTVEHDAGLRGVVIRTIAQHMQLLESPEIEGMMRELNGLSFDLLKHIWHQQVGVRAGYSSSWHRGY